MWINTYPSHILPGDNMISKNELIRKILNETIRFKADGKNVTVSQFSEGPVITINEVTITSEGPVINEVTINEGILSLFNIFEIPDHMDTPYGVVEYDFAGTYNYTKER